MKILAFCTSWWDNPLEASQRGDGMYGLKAWYARVQQFLGPCECFIACGTWSDPAYSPLSSWVQIINSGVTRTKPYEVVWWNYAGCAMTAALAYALNRNDWDLLICLDTDVLIGAVDFPALLTEFVSRPELMLNQDWHGRPGGSFIVLKREGASLYQHGRLRGNLVEKPDTLKYPDWEPILIEDEWGLIFKDRWWSPWPQFKTMRQDYGQDAEKYVKPEETMQWPFVRLPHPKIIDDYLKFNTSRAKPLAASSPSV